MDTQAVYSAAAAALSGAAYYGLFRLTMSPPRHRAPQPQCATSYGEAQLASRETGVKHCRQNLTHGGTSSVFFDADQHLANTAKRNAAVTWITRQVARLNSAGHTFAGIAFIEKESGPTGLIGLQYLIGQKVGLQTCVIRLRRYPFLPTAAIKGNVPKVGEDYLLISDVSTTGGHLLKAAEVLRNPSWSARATAALVLLNRGGDAVVREMASHGIELVAKPEVTEEWRREARACGTDPAALPAAPPV